LQTELEKSQKSLHSQKKNHNHFTHRSYRVEHNRSTSWEKKSFVV